MQNSFYKVRLLFLLVILFSFSYSSGQDPASELRHILKKYRDIENYSVHIDMRLYDSYESQKVSEQYKGKVMAGKNLYFSELENNTVFRNGKFSIAVNTEHKTMVLAPAGKHNALKNEMVDIDSSIQAYKSMKLEKQDDNLNTLVLEPKENKYARIRVQYNPGTHLISKIVFYLAESFDGTAGAKPERIEIIYTNISMQPFSKEAFSEKKYIRLVNSKYAPSAAYKGYKFINYYKK